MQIEQVAVVGLGTMGAGIAEVFARAGVRVVAVEVNEELLAAGRKRVAASTGRAVERGRMTADDQQALLDRMTFTTARADVAGCDLVVEAIPERLELKASLFAELDSICGPATVFATNTSSLPVTALAARSGRPARVVGMHFFNPAPVMRLVEVVRTVVADEEAVAAVVELAGRVGKTAVTVADRAGFIANALLFGYLNDAGLAVERQHAPMTDVDAAMTEAAGFPMGPVTLMDLIGLDVCVEVLDVMYAETRDRRYAAAPLLRRLVLAGMLGRKTGRGYYDYDDGDPRPAARFTVEHPVTIAARRSPTYLVDALLYPHLDDAVRMVDDNYATRDDVDTAMRLGCGYPRGPFQLIDEIGAATVVAGLGRTGRVPSPLLLELAGGHG